MVCSAIMSLLAAKEPGATVRAKTNRIARIRVFISTSKKVSSSAFRVSGPRISSIIQTRGAEDRFSLDAAKLLLSWFRVSGSAFREGSLRRETRNPKLGTVLLRSAGTQHEMAAAILLPAAFIAFRAERLFLAVADSVELSCLHTQLHQRITHRAGAIIA